MASICFYFQVHQPYRLRAYPVFDVGERHDYYDVAANRGILERVADKCYLPTNTLLRRLLEGHPPFRVAFSLSGVFLEQCREYAPAIIDSFQRLVATGRVELLGETSHHSLAFLYDRAEFDAQVERHGDLVWELFGVRPRVFRNTELIYCDALAGHLAARGYRGALTEGADHILGWRSPGFVYQSAGGELPLLLKNYRLADDIAFRFGQPDWPERPLLAEKYAAWLASTPGDLINLFMDYETFGEHQWAETGIFAFLEALPSAVLRYPRLDFVTPSEALARYTPVARLSMPDPVSWADIERDLSAWRGNRMQEGALRAIYALGAQIRAAATANNDPTLLDDWRRLQTSDHFYYICTKWFNDGDVHKYFNPYESPYEAFITYHNVLNDLTWRVNQALSARPEAAAVALA